MPPMPQISFDISEDQARAYADALEIATKSDIADMRADLVAFRGSTETVMSGLAADTVALVAALRTDMAALERRRTVRMAVAAFLLIICMLAAIKFLAI